MRVSDFLKAQAEPQECRTCDGEVIEPDSEQPLAFKDYVEELETDGVTARELLSTLVDELESVLSKDKRLRDKDGTGFLGVNQRVDIVQSVATTQEFLDQFVEFDQPEKGNIVYFA